MTAGELIDALRAFDPDETVCVRNPCSMGDTSYDIGDPRRTLRPGRDGGLPRRHLEEVAVGRDEHERQLLAGA